MVVLAGWLNRQQQAAIEYLKAENEVLRSQLKGRRLRLTDEERRRLVLKGRMLGRKLLADVASKEIGLLEGRVVHDSGLAECSSTIPATLSDWSIDASDGTRA